MEQETVTLTNIEVMNLYRSLTKLYQNSELRFPISFTYKLYKNIQSIENIVLSIQNFYSQNFDGEDVDSFDEETLYNYNEFCMTKNTITIEKVSIDDLKNINLSIKDYQAIDFMIK